MIYYSGSTKGWYFAGLHPKNTIPSDVVVVTETEYNALLIGQTKGVGQGVIPSDTGHPVLGGALVDSDELEGA